MCLLTSSLPDMGANSQQILSTPRKSSHPAKARDHKSPTTLTVPKEQDHAEPHGFSATENTYLPSEAAPPQNTGIPGETAGVQKTLDRFLASLGGTSDLTAVNS